LRNCEKVLPGNEERSVLIYRMRSILRPMAKHALGSSPQSKKNGNAAVVNHQSDFRSNDCLAIAMLSRRRRNASKRRSERTFKTFAIPIGIDQLGPNNSRPIWSSGTGFAGRGHGDR